MRGKDPPNQDARVPRSCRFVARGSRTRTEVAGSNRLLASPRGTRSPGNVLRGGWAGAPRACSSRPDFRRAPEVPVMNGRESSGWVSGEAKPSLRWGGPGDRRIPASSPDVELALGHAEALSSAEPGPIGRAPCAGCLLHSPWRVAGPRVRIPQGGELRHRSSEETPPYQGSRDPDARLHTSGTRTFGPPRGFW